MSVYFSKADVSYIWYGQNCHPALPSFITLYKTGLHHATCTVLTTATPESWLKEIRLSWHQVDSQFITEGVSKLSVIWYQVLGTALNHVSLWDICHLLLTLLRHHFQAQLGLIWHIFQRTREQIIDHLGAHLISCYRSWSLSMTNLSRII